MKVLSVLVGICLWASEVLSQTTSVATPTAPVQVEGINWSRTLDWIIEAIIFGLVGIAILIVAYYLWEAITPYSVKKQLIEEKNIAVALVVAAFIIGTSIVIAAALSPG